MKWLCIFSLGLVSASSLLLAGERTSMPEVWMMPPAAPDGRCWRELFAKPEDWAETRSRVTVLGYWARHLDKQFTDEELRAWLPQIETWGLKLGLEVGAVKEWGPAGVRRRAAGVGPHPLARRAHPRDGHGRAVLLRAAADQEVRRLRGGEDGEVCGPGAEALSRGPQQQ